MSPVEIGIIGIIGLLFMLFVFGTPVSFAMAITGFIGYCCVRSYDAGLNMLGTILWDTFSKHSLTLIPLFIFMGQIVFHSGVNKRLYNAAHAWIGHVSGGIAMATIAACAAFASICGSNTATAATMTTVAYPEMKKYNYNTYLSLGAIACGSTLGVVIPPSVVLIIIGLSTEQSIPKLFYGGIGAGLLLTVMLILTAWLICKIKPSLGPKGPKTDFREKIRSLGGAYEMLLLFVLIILGLYLGIFTPTEAGAVGAFMAMVIGFVQGSLTIHKLINAIKETLRSSCMVVAIVAGSMIFGRFLTYSRIPSELSQWAINLPVSPVVIMIVIFTIYIIGGAIMDALGLLLITIPIFFPVAQQLGYDPLWFAVIITVITTLGAITPPVGATVYVVGGMAKGVTVQQAFKGVLWFLPTYILCIIILMLLPQIITILPSMIK